MICSVFLLLLLPSIKFSKPSFLTCQIFQLFLVSPFPLFGCPLTELHVPLNANVSLLNVPASTLVDTLKYLFKQVYQNFQLSNYLQSFLTDTPYRLVQRCSNHSSCLSNKSPCPIKSLVNEKLGCFAFFNHMQHPALKTLLLKCLCFSQSSYSKTCFIMLDPLVVSVARSWTLFIPNMSSLTIKSSTEMVSTSGNSSNSTEMNHKPQLVHSLQLFSSKSDQSLICINIYIHLFTSPLQAF